MVSRALQIGVAIAWLASAGDVAYAGHSSSFLLTVPVGVVIIAASAFIHYSTWSARFRSFIGVGILVLVTGDLIPYWIIAYLTNPPFGIVTAGDQLTGFVAGLIAVIVGWYGLMAVVDFEGGQNTGPENAPSVH